MLLEPDLNHPHDEIWDEFASGGEDEEDSSFPFGECDHISRLRPCHSLFNELIIVVAHAMSQMPKLRKLVYRTEGVSVYESHWPCDFAFCCYQDGVGNDAKTRMDWLFGCHDAQLLGWRIPEEVPGILRQRWGSELKIAYTTDGELDERGWIRKTSDGQVEEEQEEEKDDCFDFFWDNEPLDDLG